MFFCNVYIDRYFLFRSVEHHHETADEFPRRFELGNALILRRRITGSQRARHRSESVAGTAADSAHTSAHSRIVFPQTHVIILFRQRVGDFESAIFESIDLRHGFIVEINRSMRRVGIGVVGIMVIVLKRNTTDNAMEKPYKFIIIIIIIFE